MEEDALGSGCAEEAADRGTSKNDRRGATGRMTGRDTRGRDLTY